MRYENFGPVANPDGSPSDVTLAMFGLTPESAFLEALEAIADVTERTFLEALELEFDLFGQVEYVNRDPS